MGLNYQDGRIMVVFVCLCSHEARGFIGNKCTSSGMHKTRYLNIQNVVPPHNF
jgi:hypothetical protein